MQYCILLLLAGIGIAIVDLHFKINKIMAQNDDINTALDELGTSLSNIADDITKLTNAGTPGLTKEQADAIVIRVRTVADAAKGIADITPDE